MSRSTYTSRDVRAGCWACGPDGGHQAMWTHRGAQGTAARHTDATGHETWVDVNMAITYTSGGVPAYKRVETNKGPEGPSLSNRDVDGARDDTDDA